MLKRLIGTAVKLIVTVGLFVLLFRPETYGFRPDLFGGVTPRTLWKELTGVDRAHAAMWLAFAALVKLAGMVAGVIRWQLLLYGQGLKMPLGYMIQTWFVGRFFGIFLPGTIGMDGYRLYDSAMYTREPIKSATVIAVEKLIGFVALTFLVFLTFPLGFALLKINVAVLACIMCVLGAFVVVAFLLLLNPRVLQVLVAVLPVPGSVRHKIDKLGAAATAYSGQRKLLAGAVVAGLLVHLATCFMFFGTMMALRAPNTNLLDILFASPIMIYGTVIGPSIGGEGIREIVFASLLGSKSGVATSVLFAHLGWWIGDFVPFVIGAPIFFLRSRPARKELEAKLAAARSEAAETADTGTHLSPWAVVEYRNRLVDCALAGAGAGLLAGSAVAVAEAYWVKGNLPDVADLSAFWWGPIVYGIVFMGIGMGAAGGLAFIYLLFDRFFRPSITFGLCLGAMTSLAIAMSTAVWCFKRNALGHSPGIHEILLFLCGAGVLACVLALLGGGIAFLFPRRRVVPTHAVIFLFLAIAGGSSIYGITNAPPPRKAMFTSEVKSSGPNIILLVADALRADYLGLYNQKAKARTPKLDALAKDAVLFQNCFSQASWTKPAFASMFSARYPESHTATTELSPLPDEIVTLAEILSANGYFTKGFANNPNIMSIFNFGQGFTDYVDLKPNLYFGAGYSASKLALYEGLRIARHVFVSKISKKMVVTDFYQPAENVTRQLLDWLDSNECPKDTPFFLFTHWMDPHDPYMDHSKPGMGYARIRLGNPDAAAYLEPMRDAYISEIEHLDAHLGAFIEGLRKRGLYDNSVILFTSDHGEEFYDHRGWWHGMTLYDEVVRTPLLLKLPKNEKAGAVNADFARAIDLAPTLLHFAGAKPDAAMSGKSLFGEDGAFANADIGYVYSENDLDNNVLQSTRTREGKVVFANPDNPRGLAPLECYDLGKDSTEQHNLATAGTPTAGLRPPPCNPDLEKLTREMMEFTRGNAAEPGAEKAISDEQKEQLRGLGYLGAK